jgi:glucose-6-phosphate-specific signal transduction histidine kinase
MRLWQRLLVTLVAMAAASLLVGLIWRALFGFELPSYLAGVVGGLTAVPVWELLKRLAPKGPQATPPTDSGAMI